jgi:urease accessory protein
MEPDMRIAYAQRSQHSHAAVKPLLALLLAMAPALACAHPGHPDSGSWAGLLHPFHGLDHVLAAVAVGVWAAGLHGRASYAVPAAFVAAMAAGAGLALAGFSVPAMEPMIAVSVLALGALVACDARIPALAGLALIAAFAPFHGAAHVAGMPAAAGGAAGFVLGLLIATALLHAAGVVMALALRARVSITRAAGLGAMLAGLAMLVTRVGA